MGCFLQYLYTGEYYPKVLGDGKLESDKGGQTTDENGEQLLKHAKVYSLAGKFGVDVNGLAQLLQNQLTNWET